MHHLRTQKAFLAAVLIRQFNPHIHRSGNVDLVSVFIRDLDIKQAHVRSAALCPAQGIFGSGNVFVIQRGIKRLFASGNGFIAFRRQYFRNLQLCVFRNSGFRAVGGRYPVIPSIAGQYMLLDDSSDRRGHEQAVEHHHHNRDDDAGDRHALALAAVLVDLHHADDAQDQTDDRNQERAHEARDHQAVPFVVVLLRAIPNHRFLRRDLRRDLATVGLLALLAVVE